MQINNVSLDFLGHSGFLIVTESGKRIAIDPFNLSPNISPVDFILITHGHYDHCSIKDIQKIVKMGTIILVPADAQSKIAKIKNIEMHVVEPGDEIQLGKFKIEVFPSYNINKDFHSKSEGWVGYLIKLKDIIIYHAGDSDVIPEMKRLSGYGKHGNKFIALLPVSGTYTMDAEEAAKLASTINPNLAIPMHFGSGVVGTIEDAQKFVKICDSLNVNAKIFLKI